MALVILGGGISSASGSIGGTTFSRNRFGAYIRNRTIPVNPGSPQQATVRNNFTTLVNAWTSVLTDAERAAWGVYAANVPVLNRLGQSVNLTGQNMYIRSNSPRLQAGLAIVDIAPNIFDLGDMTAPTISMTEPDIGSIAFDDTDDWVDEDGSSMLLYMSRPQNPSINFFRGPYRFFHQIDGDGTTPPTTPESATAPFPTIAGNQLFSQVRVTRVDGRLTSTFRLATTVV